MVDHRRAAAVIGALLGALLPSVVSWLLLVALMVWREEAPPSGSPNPLKAPLSMLGPGDLLAYGNPGFAGTANVWYRAYVWYFVQIVILIGLTAWSVITTAKASNREMARRRRVWLHLIAVSIAVGFVLASPWYYRLLRAPASGEMPVHRQRSAPATRS